MHEQLINYIRNYSTTPLTENEIALLKEVYVPKKLRKKQYFLQEGQVCKHVGFIVSGATRQYTVDSKGVEHISRLCIENWWTGDRESFTMLTPSIYNIDAWEETDMLIITKADSNRLESIPAINEWMRRLDNNHAFALQKRVNASLGLSAEQRYADLVNTYPEFLQRFPQHMIASYLGITRETLSRVRQKVLKK